MQIKINISFTLIDNEKTFTEILFYGEESSLFIWNMSTFLFVDFLASNYILAAIITYLLNSVSIHCLDKLKNLILIFKYRLLLLYGIHLAGQIYLKKH